MKNLKQGDKTMKDNQTIQKVKGNRPKKTFQTGKFKFDRIEKYSVYSPSGVNNSIIKKVPEKKV
jgi:hypothetical protein